MGQAQINVRTRACSRTSIARTRQAALTHNVRGKELIIIALDEAKFDTTLLREIFCSYFLISIQTYSLLLVLVILCKFYYDLRSSILLRCCATLLFSYWRMPALFFFPNSCSSYPILLNLLSFRRDYFLVDCLEWHVSYGCHFVSATSIVVCLDRWSLMRKSFGER